MFTIRNRYARGLSIIEVIISLVVFTAVAVALLTHTTTLFNDTKARKDKIFAFKKAQAILSELQALVDQGDVDAAIDLNTMDDGTTFNEVLTTQTDSGGKALAKDHILSGNQLVIDKWKWSRKISVLPFQGQENRNVRYVTVSIYQRQADDSWREAASISSVINSGGSYFPTTQYYDVYFIAIENVPGWWVYMDAIRPFMESTVTDLEARNPGLKIRTHWITKLSYGRNPRYTPHVNKNKESTYAAPFAYFYPGTMPAGSASSNYYVPDTFKGRVYLDGTLTNAVSNPTDNPDRTGPFYEYTLADQFNQAKRYYDERDLFNLRKASGDENDLEPTWRMLLEEMNANPDKFHNAILVNLHGELLPMPPIRNYSDAAKDIGNTSQNYKYARVVTHPQKIRFGFDSTTPASSEDIVLRIHPFLSDPGAAGAPSSLDYITVDLLCYTQDSEGNLVPIDYDSPGTIGITHYDLPRDGGSMVNPTPEYIKANDKDNPYDAGFTRIRFQNTPLRHNQLAAGQEGLNASCRLYGLEYIPCPMDVNGAFKAINATGDEPKNTARWVVTLPFTGLPKHLVSGNYQNVVIKAVTRIGNFQTLAEVQAADPENISTTYAWWCDSIDAVPYTERYQFMGDPRHCPYADNMYWEWQNNPAYPTYGNNFPSGYNPFWDDFNNASGNFQTRWLALYSNNRQFNTRTSNYWPYVRDYWGNRQDFDVPRYSQLLRNALTRSEAIYTTLTGFSYYYMGIGNEIGYDSANGYPSSIPVNGAPWGAAGTSTVYVDNISGGGNSVYRYSKLLRSNNWGGWWGRYWIGELYPDEVFDSTIWPGSKGADWVTSGNLPTNLWGFASNYSFQREQKNSVTWDLPVGTSLDIVRKVTGSLGCGSVLLTGTSTSTFNHQYCSGQSGTLTAGGPEMGLNYGFALPTSAGISRPFKLDVSNYPTEYTWTNAYPRFTASLIQTYYDHQGGSTGSGLVQLLAPTSVISPQRGAFIVVNGMDRTVENGSGFIAKYSVLSLIHSFFEAGQVSSGPRIAQVPRVQIKGPTDITELSNPTEIQVTYSIKWKRWDGRDYTTSTSGSFVEDESRLVYVISYSKDDGATWFNALDNSAYVPGELPASASQYLADAATGDETYKWPVPATPFPEGTYLLRIDCFRDNERLHYASHMSMIFIDR